MVEVGVAHFTEITKIDWTELGGTEIDLVPNLWLSITQLTSATQFDCGSWN